MDGWLVFAWMVPAAWGIAALIDVLMVEWEIYQSAEQATVISGLVVAVPLLLILIPGSNPESLKFGAAATGICCGILYALHLRYFYKALFTVNDAAHTEAFMNTEVVFVPVLAFIFLGESLNDAGYLSIILAGAGVVVLNWESQRVVTRQKRLVLLLAVAVVVSSVGFILQDILFTLTSYRSGLIFYAIGVVVGIAPGLLHQGVTPVCGRLFRYLKLIAFAELFAVIATLASMRAIATAPSVSLVAVIETFRPIVIMIVCAVAWCVMRRMSNGCDGTIVALREQFSGSFRKLFACALISSGVFFASLQ